ncbi:TolB family protein [Maribacter sp. 2-571]|uniref:TolB family protein n=1 Tax=Maribacter sp. 2-571 TaxID=3417569 RepID=UPI003D339F54
MMKKLIPLMICLYGGLLSAQENHLYLGETAPDTVPKIFAEGIISKASRSEFGSVFSADGTTFYFAVNDGGKAEIRYSQWQKESWTTPKTVIGHAVYSFNDPMLSPDENRLYYISDKPKTGETPGDYDIWYSEKTGSGWSHPINAGTKINSEKDEYYISFTANGTLYFSSNKDAGEGNDNNFDIYASKSVNGEHQEPVRLSSVINTKYYEADVFVAPDEAYLIFCSRRPQGLGRGDLYISTKEPNGKWGAAQHLKKPISTDSHELCPWVTPDGAYFFYTGNQDIYWVSTRIFEQVGQKK